MVNLEKLATWGMHKTQDENKHVCVCPLGVLHY
jgi:hypothetical protein